MTLNRKKREKITVNAMIGLYCRKNHKQENHQLCMECNRLKDYLHKKIENCVFDGEKTSCSTCPSKCYSPNQANEVKKMMRYSGPRFLFYHPILSILQLTDF